MKLAEQILLPIDIQHPFQHQIDSTAMIARSFGSVVIPIYIITHAEMTASIKSAVEEKAKEKLLEVCTLLSSLGVVVKEPLVEFGSAALKIAEVAMDLDVNLVVVSAGNFIDLDLFKLGTTTEKLLEKCDKPVWVIKPTSEKQISKIICPVDFSAPSTRALKNAIEITRRFGASLTVVSVFEPMINGSLRLGALLDSENDRMLKMHRKQFDAFLKDFAFHDVNYEATLLEGNPYVQILKCIKEEKFDLLLMGTNGRTGFSRMLMGSVTEKVTRELPCSFITTKSSDVVNMELKNQVSEIERHYRKANEYFDKGELNQALLQYRICLQINSMHIPSIYKIAHIYKSLKDEKNAKYYEQLASHVIVHTWGEDFEDEIRTRYGFNN